MDHIDEQQRSGWSVIVRGAGREVELERVPDLLRRMSGHPLLPWALGIHNVWLQFTPRGVTGRRLGASRGQPVF